MRLVKHLLSVLILTLLTIVTAQDEPITNIIFMHHSTGAGVISDGDVRARFTDLGYAFWDHGYNEDGLTGPDGQATGTQWDVPGDNTDPDGWAAIFSQPVTDPPANTFSHMLDFDVIIFKSCFPSCNIRSEAQLTDYQAYYATIREAIDQHPNKLFIVWTSPPLVPNETTPENAQRARQWADYLVNDFIDGRDNLAVFDFFGLMSDEDGYLQADYRSDQWDSHPNAEANAMAGSAFVDFVHQAIQDFVPDDAVSPEATIEPEATASTSPRAEHMIDDFDADDDAAGWWQYIDEDAGSFACEQGQPGYMSANSLEIAYALDIDKYAGCGRDIEPDTSSTATGIEWIWRSDIADLMVHFVVMVEETPFEITLQSPGPEWRPVTVTWDMLVKAPWYGEEGRSTFDATLAQAIGFDLGFWDREQAGTVWIDDIHFIDG